MCDLRRVKSQSTSTTAPRRAAPRDGRWWRDAVVYQVYVKSFADANGDGTGDIAGVRERLPYLRELGVDALVQPRCPSRWPTGYDVPTTAIEPSFGRSRRSN
jgi:alpha-glucosidase